MALRAVFLDVGNTLVRERPSRFAIYAQAAAARGIDLDERAMRALMVEAHAELPREIAGSYRYGDAWFEAYLERIFHAKLGLGRAALPELSRELFARFSDPATFELHHGALELLEGLRAAGLRVGLISNWSARLPGLLAALGVAQRVDFTLCSAIERLEKPDPLFYELALKRAGVRADEAVHAGDDLEKDVLGARRSGLRAVLVDHARARRGLATPRVENLSDLLDLFARVRA
jgi:putative hydrolase of the HAD superfamily